MFSTKRARVSALVVIWLAVAAAASAQTSVNSDHPYGLNPYRPTDAAWLRNYGAAIVTQAPLSEVLKMDPFNPTQAALMRQFGGAIPLWIPGWFGAGPAAGTPMVPLAGPGGPQYFGAQMLGRNLAANGSGTRSFIIINGARANDGVSIRYEGREWTMVGRAEPLQLASFTRVGEYAGSPVYRRANASDDLIYVSTNGGVVAPFRAKP